MALKQHFVFLFFIPVKQYSKIADHNNQSHTGHQGYKHYRGFGDSYFHSGPYIESLICWVRLYQKVSKMNIGSTLSQ